ncbi:MAG: hypothetical protein Kow0022_06970 [Phycisphaerales bacterium]
MSQETSVEVVFCLRNIDRANFETLKAIAAENPEIRLIPAGCLCNCSRCVEVPFLQINGRIVEGATHASILDEVRSALHR